MNVAICGKAIIRIKMMISTARNGNTPLKICPAGFLLCIFDHSAEVIREGFDLRFLGLGVQQGEGVAQEIGGGFFGDEQVVFQLLFCRVVADGTVFRGQVVGQLFGGLVVDLLGEGDEVVIMFYVHRCLHLLLVTVL